MSLISVSAVFTFFGSTKIAHALGAPLGVALFLPAVYVTVAIMLGDNGAKP